MKNENGNNWFTKMFDNWWKITGFILLSICVVVIIGLILFIKEFLPTLWSFVAKIFNALIFSSTPFLWLLLAFLILIFLLLLHLLYIKTLPPSSPAPLPSKWDGIEDTTELIGYAKKLEDSNYTPEKIWKRDRLKQLWVMGNGCSKWTNFAKQGKNESNKKEGIRKDLTEKIILNGGSLRFMISCPIFLVKKIDGDSDKDKKFRRRYAEIGNTSEEKFKEWLEKKSKNNANSLIKLRDLKKSVKATYENFEIRTYESLATLRIVVVDNCECTNCATECKCDHSSGKCCHDKCDEKKCHNNEVIIGHYTEGANKNSWDSPLLIFKDIKTNDWGLAGGYKRLFDEQWEDAKEPTKWEGIEKLAK